MKFDLEKIKNDFKNILAKETELNFIFQLLNQEANNAYLVGGCVRDFILFNKLVYDIDIATCLIPDEVFKRLTPHFKVIPTGLKHGTVTVVGKYKYEITTFRTDEETDGRHALVKFNNSWEIDSNRRDFTINGLYSDINGNIYDAHNGISDLSNFLVKFINDPEKRIHEDYLRILRFFRFVARFGSFDSDSLQYCIKLCDNLKSISKERITQEWFKIIEGKYFWQILEELRPVLNIIGMNAYFGKEIKLSKLGLTFCFMQEENLLMLSNFEKKYIKNLKQVKLENQKDAIIIKLKYGNDFLKDKMIVEDKIFKVPEMPLFELDGKDLIAIGFSGKEIGIQLELLKEIWAEKLGKITKQELLEIALDNFNNGVNS